MSAVFASSLLAVDDTEEKLVSVGIDFLEKARFDFVAVDTIDKRAEVGGAASQVRTLLPLLLFSVLLAFDGIELDMWEPVVAASSMGIIFVALAFLLEADRANTDAVIRQAIAEYRGIQQRRKMLEDSEMEIVRRLLKIAP